MQNKMQVYFHIDIYFPLPPGPASRNMGGGNIYIMLLVARFRSRVSVAESCELWVH